MNKSTIFAGSKRFFYLLLIMTLTGQVFSQSSNCATATQITLTGGAACVNGTSAGAITDNILYGGCNAAPVNMVWYTYVTNGSNNTFTVDPGTMTNAEIVIYTGNCPNGPGSALETCTAVTGATNINNNWGMTAGQQVWIGIASNGGVDGTFQFCVNSQPPAPGVGNTCATAKEVCGGFSMASMPANSSGQKPNCFGSAPQRDTWIKFTVTQSGLLAWTGTPNVSTTEFDWALWDISGGCPGTVVCCNYQYVGGSTLGFGMQNQTGTVTCGSNSALPAQPDASEFCPKANVTCGKTYAIQISNYSNTSAGFSFSFVNSTATINSTSNFAVTPTLVCGTSLSAAITNSSTGTCNQVWDFGDASANYTGGTPGTHTYTTPGTYAIVANNSGACPSSFTQFVQLLAPLAATISAVPASCPGVCNGTAKLNDVTGGNGVYAYSWSTGATTSSVTGLCAGIYSVTITNTVCGTSITKTVAVTSPPAITLTPASNAPFCSGGTLNLTVSGASTYTWSGSGLASPTGSAISTATPATGTYSVTGTSTLGCVSTATLPVVINPKPALSLTPTNPTCGNANGTIVINDLSTPAGQGPFTFASTAGTISGQTITAVPAGVVTVTMTNVFGCNATATTTLITPPFPTAIATATTNAFCGNANGTLSYTASPGTAPYTYSVNNVTSTSPTSILVAGTYTVKVRDTNGCTFSVTATISNIPGPTAITGTTTLASCNTNNGTYNVTGVTGGTPAYTYSVDGVGTASLTSGLAAGTHTVTVKDFNGCLFSTTFAIGTANGPSSFVVNTTNSNCGLANGTSTVSGVVGGTPTYSFSFDGGAFGTGTTASGLLAGTHTMTVKDANSCTITATYSVANNPPPTVAVTSTLNVLCNGASTGSLTVTPTGGTAPFTYTLTTPTQTNTTGNFTGLTAGVYTITIKDNFGCTATTSVTLTQPTVLTGTTSSIPANCFGNATGTLSAGGAGGTAPYTYLWSLGSSTLATVGGAAAGTYTVTIKDANLCTITRTVTVTQPTSLTLTSTLTPATCGNANGSGTVTVGGGTTPYTYNWSNGDITNVLTAALAGTYTITAQDFNGCVITRTVAVTNIPGPTAISGTTTLAGCGLNNGTYSVTGVTGGTSAYSYSVDAVATASLTSGLAAGTHTITVKDFNGCLFSTTFVINTASGPTTASIVTTNASCGTANGTATVTSVTGGLAPYQYSFDGGAFGAGTTTSGLVAGTHSVTIRDANSCTLTVTYTEFNNSGPTASVTNSVNILCNGNSTGSFTVTPAGGIAPFTYTLATPSQTNSTGVFTGLPAGSYNVTVKDNSGCTAAASVTLTQPTPVTLTVTALPVSCFGTSTGTVSASGSGGTGTLTYVWPALGGSTLATVNNVAAGTYSVTQTDANGCSITQSVTVTQPTSLTLTSTLTPATCGNANGSGTVTVGGGTPAYTYNWSNGGITPVLTGASAGTYTINVTDFKGCIITRTVTVTNIPGPTAITGTTTLAGCGLSNGTYNVTGVTGGTSAYSFSVDAIATVSLTSGLAAGTHTISVSDQNGCLFSTTFNIGTTAGPSTAAVTSSNASCGTANGSATVTGVTGGTATYQYSFDGGAFTTGANTSGLLAGTHTVTIKDANSCTVTVTYPVLNNGSPTLAIPTTTNTTCFGGSNGGFTAVGSGGSGAPFTYTLTAPFQNNSTGIFSGLIAGTYSVIVKDMAGCTASTTVTITEPTAVTLVPTSLPVKCFGTATGTINIAGSGGTGAYTYSLNGGSPQASSSYTAVGAGTYVMAIKDANGCVATQTVVVTQPAALAISVSSQNANCTSANGIGSSTVTGGTGTITYTWTGGGGAGSVSNGLIGGTYTVTATDGNGCVISSPVVIGITPGGSAAITASSNITCFNANNGSLTAGMTGGTSPFTYSWTPGGQTTQVATGLAPGSYTCVVTDFYGCKANASGTLTQPTVLTSIMNSNNVKCYGTATGTVSAAGSGGTGPYTYLWPTIPSTLYFISF